VQTSSQGKRQRAVIKTVEVAVLAYDRGDSGSSLTRLGGAHMVLRIIKLKSKIPLNS
jgi:hypothetical protein